MLVCKSIVKFKVSLASLSKKKKKFFCSIAQSYKKFCAIYNGVWTFFQREYIYIYIYIYILVHVEGSAQHLLVKENVKHL